VEVTSCQCEQHVSNILIRHTNTHTRTRVTRWRRFLAANSGGISAGATRSTIAGSRTAAIATARPPLNFHTFFKALHQAEAAKQGTRARLVSMCVIDYILQSRSSYHDLGGL
jgi:hypothetical protein